MLHEHVPVEVSHWNVEEGNTIIFENYLQLAQNLGWGWGWSVWRKGSPVDWTLMVVNYAEQIQSYLNKGLNSGAIGVYRATLALVGPEWTRDLNCIGS